MFKNYLKIAFRNLWKNTTSSLINIFGLTIGLTCCLLIGLYIQHELSYDRFQTKGDRIVRVIMEYSFGERVERGNYTGNKVAPAFKRNFAEVESAIRMSRSMTIVKYEDKLFTEPAFVFADSTFFDIFSFKLLRGDPKKVLEGPKMVLLTQSTAKKYFGDSDPVGKIIKVGVDGVDFTVSGVTEDCPSNSQIKYDLLASFSSLGPIETETYWNANYTTYFLLKNKESIASLQSKIRPFMKKEIPDERGTYITYYLEPYRDVHLYSPYGGFEPNNSITYIYIISAVALLILAIACFTYINLSTAKSLERAKEVGIRKVIGAFKKQIFWQFIGESIILSVISLLLSVLLTMLLLPSFNELADKQLSISSLFTPVALGAFVFILCCISLLAGSYPALILSAFQPIKVLKGSFKNTGSGLWMRKSLIVFQFVISVFLIVATFVIQGQLHFIQNKKMGYNREHVMVFPYDKKMTNSFETIRTEFKSNPNVLSISRSVSLPTNIVGGYNMRRPDMPEDQQIMVRANPIDDGYIKTSGLEIIAGTDLSAQDLLNVANEKQDKNEYAYILNESACKELGWKPDEAVGKKMFLGNQRPGFVKAVIKDFHFESLHNAIKPLVLFPEVYLNTMMVKLSGNNLPQTISFLEGKWKTLVPHRPFEFHFLDEDFNKLYSSELRIGKVLNVFAGTAILLACLGLFGLSSYAAQQRIKEIGIRKVLGASVSSIVTILSKDFIKLATVATIIATPVAWWVMSKWLQDFTYRINMSWWIFVAAGAACILIALMTVSFQAVKAALSNPIKNLRTE